MKRRTWQAAIIAIALALALVAGVVAGPLAQDIIVEGGPRGDIQTLYRSFDGGAYEAQVMALAPYDDTTGATITIDYPHHEIHDGGMFHAEHTNSSVSNNNNLDLAIQTGAGDPHMVFEVLAGGQVTVYLYESPTLTTTGTALTEYNMLRSSTNVTASTQISHTPTVANVGTTVLVNGRILPGGNSPTTRVGGGIRQGTEWILKPRTTYLLRANNSSGGSIAINLVAEWYEE